MATQKIPPLTYTYICEWESVSEKRNYLDIMNIYYTIHLVSFDGKVTLGGPTIAENTLHVVLLRAYRWNNACNFHLQNITLNLIFR